MKKMGLSFMNPVYILTGPVKSGKTTNLKIWCERQNSADGILAPVSQNKRHLYHISNKTSRLLERVVNDSQPLKIGTYSFDESAFRWARNKLKEAAGSSPEWLIIDEIGPLELTGKGLEPAVSEILKTIIYKEIRLLLVVRKPLVEQVIMHYNLEPERIRIIGLSDLKYIE